MMTSDHNHSAQALIDLSNQKWLWMAERNVTELGALFNDQAVFVHMGATMDKAHELEVIGSGFIQYKNADIEDVSVRFIGNTAIVLSKLKLLAEVAGNEVINPFVVTEVYIEQQASWQLGSMSFTKLIEVP